jgi:hypothetical protein
MHNAQAEARATEYKPTPAKKRPLWPVASSAVLGPAHAAKRVEHLHMYTYNGHSLSF